MTLDYRLIQQRNDLQICLRGALTGSDEKSFRKVIERAGQKNTESIVLDFTEVDFIDSTGLGLLLLLRDACMGKNVPLSISGVNGQVEKIFSLSKFDLIFSIKQ